MTDVLPADLIPAAKVRECLSSHQMVLDLLLDEGIPVAFSEVEAQRRAARPRRAGRNVPRPNPAARDLTETMYRDGAARRKTVRCSGAGTTSSRAAGLVRDTPAKHDPAIVLQLFADT